MAALYDVEIVSPPVPVVMWQDLFVLVDKGNAQVSDYPVLERMVFDQSRQHPGGLGCLVIIPANASPPPDEVRQAIKGVLTRLGPKLRCLCWVVEGTGFRAAAVRATLTGLRMISRTSYPTGVADSMSSALTWVLKQMPLGTKRSHDIAAALRVIESGRRSIHPGRSELVS